VWSAEIILVAGAVWAQMGKARGQRGWKRHPVGGFTRLGGEPGMPVSLFFSPLMEGKEFIRPRV
jgi:hypothetical protein